MIRLFPIDKQACISYASRVDISVHMNVCVGSYYRDGNIVLPLIPGNPRGPSGPVLPMSPRAPCNPTKSN